uniref:Potassium channel domain-containing protein n=1 Tax=Globodera rostochiensis TaxID=31243 RepID=A0A914GPP1_GLORO
MDKLIVIDLSASKVEGVGYGKIEPETIQARLFTVVWGFFGVPFTVIILTNLGLYMRRFERHIRRHYCQKRHRERIAGGIRRLFRRGEYGGRWNSEETISINPWFYEDEELEDAAATKQISPFTMAAVVLAYLALGALLLPLLKGQFDFIDGLFYSYLCFTAIEYGHLIPENVTFIPIVLLYMCVGLAMSTIALDIGSNYVKKLYYLGKRATTIAHANFFYGGKHVSVRDLLTAVGQAIGISEDALEKVDLDRMVDDAIAVKKGQLDRVPQNYVFMEGIWPPELIPLFQREGQFPEWADADELRQSIRTTGSSMYNNNLAMEVPALSLLTFADGRLHRSLHSTSSTSGSLNRPLQKKDRNNNTKQ